METIKVKVLEVGRSPYTGRLYSKAVLLEMMNQFSANLGELIIDNESSHTLNISDASHFTNKMFLSEDGNELWVEITLLDTPNGKLMKSAIQYGKCRFTPIMMGKLDINYTVLPEGINYLRIAGIVTE